MNQINIKFIYKYFPNTLESINAFQKIKHGKDITENDKKYLKECIENSIPSIINEFIEKL